jgi:subtilisin-like proprotein convertase family protein
MQSMKPWHRMDSVPNKFTLSRMTVAESDCVTEITVNVLLVHSTPSNVRITLTRSGPASAAQRARSLVSTVVLKQFGGTPRT